MLPVVIQVKVEVIIVVVVSKPVTFSSSRQQVGIAVAYQ